jgi:NAD(P)-dependent dehydrogenase (short-subunit alcohol dehydrogenase family)
LKINDIAAIVTGGASGLGGATAAMLAARGARVTIVDRDRETAEAHATALAEAEQAHGVARILVNCAGVAPAIKTVGKENVPHPLDAFRRAVEINLIGTFAMIARFSARLVAAEPIGEERGVIMNTASVAAYDGQVGQAAYAASKGGVVGMTLPIARDLAQHRIRVMTIAPGIFLTPMLMGLPQAAQDSLGTQVPHPSRLGKPDEYAALVEAILTNPMLNGDVIRLDGAIRMAPR